MILGILLRSGFSSLLTQLVERGFQGMVSAVACEPSRSPPNALINYTFAVIRSIFVSPSPKHLVTAVAMIAWFSFRLFIHETPPCGDCHTRSRSRLAVWGVCPIMVRFQQTPSWQVLPVLSPPSPQASVWRSTRAYGRAGGGLAANSTRSRRWRGIEGQPSLVTRAHIEAGRRRKGAT